jgi:hypothetical protein
MDNLPATTTIEQDLKTKQKRTVDFIIEFTQMILALGITFATIYISIQNIESETLTNAFFLIVGFYFGKQFKDKLVGLSIKEVKS